MSSSERTPLLTGNSHEPDKSEEKTSSTLTASLEKENFSFKTISRRKKFILISMSLQNFFAAACFSLPAPFFPHEALSKGASSTVIGFIFGVFEFVIFCTSPIFGNFISRIGCKFMFISGAMVCGTCAILFGTLNIGPDGTIFIVMCFLCRCMEALGCSAYVTALFAILAHEFPDNVITVMGSLETFSGLGMMVGPPLGGFLYEIGGFGLPFYILGTCVIICGVMTTLFMPSIPEGKKMYKGSILQLLKSPLVLVTFINIVAGSTSLGYMDPTLSNHLLSSFHLKTWLIGIMFLIAPGVYALTAPIWGYLGDKKGHIRLMICLGSTGAIFSMLLLGPSPLFRFIPNELYINVIALVLVGLTVGCCLIPTFKALLVGANGLGMPDDLDTYGKVSGFFNSSFSLGAFIGPTIGGALVDEFGFPSACSAVAGSFAFAALVMLIHILAVRHISPIPETKDKVAEVTVTTDNKAFQAASSQSDSDISQSETKHIQNNKTSIDDAMNNV